MNAEKLYRKLFFLPGKVTVVVTFLMTTILLLILESKIIILVTLLLFTIAASRKLLGLKFDAKRSLFLTTLISFLSFLSYKLFGTFSGSFFLFLAVIHFCSERGAIYSALIASIPFLILDYASIPFLVVSFVLFYAYLLYLDFGWDFGLRKYVESFIKFWLTGNPRFVESVLSENSKIFEGKIRCLGIGNAKVISTDFHPGPFRNIGGAKLVNFLDSPNSVYLHSPTTHEKDPVSEEDVLKIKEALKCDVEYLRPKRPFEIEGNNFKIFCFPFDKKKLIFVSGKKRIDDFELESGNFVVDCHNANFYKSLSEKEVEEIRDLVKKAEELETDFVEAKSAFVKIYAESESIVNYVSAILLDFGEKFAIVVFDSNNVDLIFRNRVEEEFAKIGFKAIVCSTDNHSKTGIRVKESYKPAGGCEEDYRILENLIEKCKSAKLEKSDFTYSENRVAVKVLGELLRKFEKVSEKSDRYIRLFLFLVIINFLIPLFVFLL